MVEGIFATGNETRCFSESHHEGPFGKVAGSVFVWLAEIVRINTYPVVATKHTLPARQFPKTHAIALLDFRGFRPWRSLQFTSRVKKHNVKDSSYHKQLASVKR